MAVAAVVRNDGDTHARAWMIWDERGFAWLAIAKNSPADLRNLWLFPKPPEFHGPGIQVRFTALKKGLPTAYRILDCPDALSYGR
jgi:hypothetical protein